MSNAQLLIICTGRTVRPKGLCQLLTRAPGLVRGENTRAPGLVKGEKPDPPATYADHSIPKYFFEIIL